MLARGCGEGGAQKKHSVHGQDERVFPVGVGEGGVVAMVLLRRRSISLPLLRSSHYLHSTFCASPSQCVPPSIAPCYVLRFSSITVTAVVFILSRCLSNTALALFGRHFHPSQPICIIPECRSFVPRCTQVSFCGIRLAEAVQPERAPVACQCHLNINVIEIVSSFRFAADK